MSNQAKNIAYLAKIRAEPKTKAPQLLCFVIGKVEEYRWIKILMKYLAMLDVK